MKRLIAVVVVVLLAFYVGWPALSGYQLRAALERKDVAGVERKIDFPAVRTSLEPVVTREVGNGMDRYLKDMGPFANMLSGVLKSQYGPKVVEATLNTLITPENVVRLYAEKDNVEAAAERIIIEELGKPGSPFAALFATSRSTDGASSVTDKLRLPGGLGGAKPIGRLRPSLRLLLRLRTEAAASEWPTSSRSASMVPLRCMSGSPRAVRPPSPT